MRHISRINVPNVYFIVQFKLDAQYISIEMENFTTITFRKLNFTDQEFHMKSFLKDIEFQQEDPTTGIWYIVI